MESMTGYSRTEYRSGGQVISVEIYSENNRFLDLTFNLPEPLEPYTEELKRLVASDLRRGRVRITIAISGLEKTPEVQLNTAFLTKSIVDPWASKSARDLCNKLIRSWRGTANMSRNL